MHSKESLKFGSFLQKEEKSDDIDLICHQFRNVILDNFENHLLYSFLAGRVAHGVHEPTSDIDCIVVLKDSAYEDSVIDKRIKRFVDGYLKIHNFFGFSPDLNFPGDVISETQKEEAIAGRGFFSENKFQCLPIINAEDWDRENVDYRVWLTELAFNNNMFIAGDQLQFQSDSKRAVDTINKFLLSLYMNKDFFPMEIAEKIIDGGISFLGFSRSYGNLENYIEEKIQSSLARLLIEESVVQNSTSGQYSSNENRLIEWHQQLISRATKPVTYLISWRDLREYVKLVKEDTNFKYFIHG